MADSIMPEHPEDSTESRNKVNGGIVNGIDQGQSDTAVADKPELAEPEEARTLTQTDHLNKRLLSSFLDRLNQTSPNNSVQPIDCSQSDPEADLDFDLLAT